MASFQDKYGTPVLPTVDDEGNVPVALEDNAEEVDFESLLGELLIEMTALRLAVQETYNEGRDDHLDFREMAIRIRDRESNEG